LILISRTIPSKVFSVLKLFLKLIDVAPVTVNALDSNSESPTAPGSGAKASFGEVSGVVPDVTHAVPAPVAELLHPDGRAGAVTPSKF
jgi:hypothetical protein